MKKTFVLVSVLLLFALVLSACSSDEPETVEVEVTRIVEVPVAGEDGEVVEVEVTRIVEVPAEGAAAAPADAPMASTGDTLDTVRERGHLVCANNGTLPGFGFVDENGDFSGFDWEYCRAVAAAVLVEQVGAVVAPRRFRRSTGHTWGTRWPPAIPAHRIRGI